MHNFREELHIIREHECMRVRFVFGNVDLLYCCGPKMLMMGADSFV